MGDLKFKIVYFQQDGELTGSAISLRHFLSGINRNLFEPVVILANDGPARFLYESLEIEVKVFHFRTFWTFPGPNCLSREMINQLRALLPNKNLERFVTEQIKPDIIHINDKAALNVGISLKNSGIPIIQHSRSSYHVTRCSIGKLLSKNNIRDFADHIICISEDEEDGFEHIKNKSIIYNTVDFDLINKAKKSRLEIRGSFNIKPEEFLVGFAANVTEKKGAWDFLELCKNLKDLRGVKFILVGLISETGKTNLGNGVFLNMTPKEYVESFIRNHKLEGQFIITGFRNDSLELMAAMDLLIVPNKNGVLGRQPIEAQAIGTPIIAVNGHSGRSKIILNNETGYLVRDINEAILLTEKFVMNKANMKMSNAAKEYALKNFSPDKNMRIIEAIYLNLISK